MISATTTPLNAGAAVSMRLELEAGHGQTRAQLAPVPGHVDEIAQP